MSSLATLVFDTAVAVLTASTDPHVDIEEVVGAVYADHPERVIEEKERLALVAIRRMAKDALARLANNDEDDGQQGILSLGLPQAIAIKTGDGYRYVLSSRANWDDLRAGRSQRETNIDRAREALLRYDRALDRLAPVMAASPQLTVAEAEDLLAALDEVA